MHGIQSSAKPDNSYRGARKTRHKHMANSLRALKALVLRTDGDNLLGSNWAVVPDNNNRPDIRRVDDEGHRFDDAPDHGWDVDKRMETKPSLRAIMRHVETGVVAHNDHGQIIRIGKLEFAGGDRDPYDTPSEAGYKIGPGGQVVRSSIRLPVGGMRHQEENAGRMRGTDNRDRADKPASESLRDRHIRETNEYIAETLKAHLPRHVRGGKIRGGKNRTHAERVKMLADAYVETTRLVIDEGKAPPVVRKFPAGLPWQPKELWSIFPSLYRPLGADTSSQGWEDICTSIINREIWAEALSGLSTADHAVLAALPKATTFEDIGVAAGQSPSYARTGGGKRILQAVNDNLAEALRKAA